MGVIPVVRDLIVGVLVVNGKIYSFYCLNSARESKLLGMIYNALNGIRLSWRLSKKLTLAQLLLEVPKSVRDIKGLHEHIYISLQPQS